MQEKLTELIFIYNFYEEVNSFCNQYLINSWTTLYSMGKKITGNILSNIKEKIGEGNDVYSYHYFSV